MKRLALCLGFCALVLAASTPTVYAYWSPGCICDYTAIQVCRRGCEKQNPGCHGAFCDDAADQPYYDYCTERCTNNSCYCPEEV